QTTVGNPGQPVPPPRGALTPIDPSTPAIPTASYDDSFRTRLNSLLGPVDITRKLTEYRASLNSPLGPGNIGNWQRAISDRQLFARDIFQRLRLATGVVTDPNTPPPPGDPTQRWLAQVAVNIVDFIDNDECITPFKWTNITDNNPGGDPNGLPASNEPTNTLAQFNNQIKNDWVFGFERPRANINEAYLRIENDKNDPLMDPVTGPRTRRQEGDDGLRHVDVVGAAQPGHAGCAGPAVHRARGVLRDGHRRQHPRRLPGGPEGHAAGGRQVGVPRAGVQGAGRAR